MLEHPSPPPRHAYETDVQKHAHLCLPLCSWSTCSTEKATYDPDWVPSISLGYEQLTTDSQAARLAFTFVLSISTVFIEPMMILCLGHVVKGGGKEKK